MKILLIIWLNLFNLKILDLIWNNHNSYEYKLNDFKNRFEEKKLYYDQIYQDITEFMNDIENESLNLKEIIDTKVRKVRIILQKINIIKQLKQEKIKNFHLSDLNIINNYKNN